MYLTKNVRRTAMAAAVMVVGLGMLCGCNEYGVLGNLGGIGSLIGGWGGGYDPTALIGGVIDNRLDSMDRTATAWDQYITGDYYGGDNDDPTTPTAWASGYEWP
jgi:hypothetical protein